MREGEDYDKTYAPVTCGIMDVNLSSFNFCRGFWMANTTSGLCRSIHPSSHQPQHVHGVPMRFQSSWRCRQERCRLKTPS